MHYLAKLREPVAKRNFSSALLMANQPMSIGDPVTSLRLGEGARSSISSTLRQRLRRLKRAQAFLDVCSGITPRRAHARPGRRIGVLMLWGIGDAVLGLPLMRGLKTAWPGCSVEVIGKPALKDLFGGETVVDRVHSLVAPWTLYERKYALGDRSWRDFARQLRVLRQERFDWLVSMRLDPRDNVLLRFLKTEATFGLVAAGGRHWLTDGLSMPPSVYYQTYCGEVGALVCDRMTGYMPSIEPQFDQPIPGVASTRERLRLNGCLDRPLLVVSFGAGRPIRRWDAAKISAALALARAHIGSIVLVDDGMGFGDNICLPPGLPSMIWRSDLCELKSLLALSDVVFCADSGVMHMAAAAGSRVVSIFGPTSLKTFGLVGARHDTVAIEPMSCRPCFDACVYASPICLDNLELHQVGEALIRALSAVKPRA